VKLSGDYFWVCDKPSLYSHPELQDPVEVKFKPQPKGSWWGWLLCAMGCSHYSGGFEYNKLKDICKCRGELLPPLWRH